MGKYIQVPENKNKAEQILKLYDAIPARPAPKTFEDIPQGWALIAVVQNLHWDAALFVEDFIQFDFVMKDTRPVRLLYMDWDKAVELTSGQSL